MIVAPVNSLKSNVNSRKRRIKNPDNPSSVESLLPAITNYTRIISSIMLRYKIKYETFRALMAVVEMWSIEGKPVSQHRIAKYSELHNRNYRNVIYRLGNLQAKGLLEVAGEAMHGGKLIVPSEKALEELSELCK